MISWLIVLNKHTAGDVVSLTLPHAIIRNIMSSEINLTPTGTLFEIGPANEPITGRTWGTCSECRALGLLVHGLGAHSGWFEAMGRRLKVRRIYAMAYDQIGFGKRQDQPFFSYQ